jgi:hypothetical protein
MKKCKSCQSEIDAKARKCPHCQTDQRNWFGKHPFLTIILIIIIIGIFGNSSNKNNSTNQSEELKTEASATPTPITITARQLADDFDANQVSAEAKWQDKYIEFSAKISNITDLGLSFSSVGSKQFSMTQISCQIKDKQQLMSLTNGQTVKVRGKVGKQTIGVIGVTDCQVIQ